VLIPAFAVDRTELVLLELHRFYQEGRLPQQMVFLDSPMAARANDIYLRHTGEFSDTDREYIRGTGTVKLSEWLPVLPTTQTPDESMAINRIKSGAIIIAGSGMCTGGRIVHHFKHNLGREECHVVFPGFQAQGTLGRAIVEGAESVRVLRQRIAVRAKIHTLGGFSAHAGQSQLIQWVSHFEHKPELYLIHGERAKMDVLQRTLLERLDWKANIPEPGDRIAI
jgi:metallo-beta-lactamase family protein